MKLNVGAPLIVALAASVTAFAQNKEAKANVPFAFVVAGQALPAGNYTFREILSPDTIAVQQAGGGEVKIALASAIELINTKGRAELVFHRYGDHYFLDQITFAGYRTNVAPTKIERELTAKAHHPDDTVVVAGL